MSAGARNPEEILDEIEQTRQELGDTAAALAQKADVKAQADRAKAAAQDKAREHQGTIMLVGGAIAALLLIRIIRR